MFCDIKPTNQSMPGTSVIFNQTADLAVASTALNESVDVDAVSMSDSQVTATLAEYGNAILTTAKLRATSYILVDPVVTNVIGFNAGASVDTVARDVFKGGSNVRYATGSGAAPAGRTSVTPSNTIRAVDVRRARAELFGANVQRFGGWYTSVIHPDVSFDLTSETGAASWRDPHTYSQPGEIWTGELGGFEGFRFVESPRAPLFADAGSSTTNTDVYRTLFFGRQAFGKAHGIQDGYGMNPMNVRGPVTDKLERFQPYGWKHLVAYIVFRQASLRALESASSIGSN